jgi:probable HAF family extracellular repeat protein
VLSCQRLFAFAFCGLLLVGTMSPVCADTVRVYRVESLGFLPGSSYLVGIATNASGDVAGYTVAGDGMLHAFRWTATTGLEDLGTNGGFSSMASGMNDHGDVVGTYWDRGWWAHPFIAPRGGVMTDLGQRFPQISQLNGISNDGRLTGSTWQWRAFRTQPDGTLQELTSNFSFGASINDSGEVAGVVWRDGSMTEPRRAFRYSDAAGLTDLGTLNGGWSAGSAINRDGSVVGFSGSTDTTPTRAFRAIRGLPMEDLGVLPWGYLGGVLAAAGINDAGDVVGTADGWLSWTPFLFTDADGIIDLRFRITTADRMMFSINGGSAINNAGQIIASGFTSTGYGTVRLTPIDREFGGPVASPTVNLPVLSPPDNRMVIVSVDPHATDEYDPEPACRITSVVSSERPASGPDPDVIIDYALSVQLRAKRMGSAAGRT